MSDNRVPRIAVLGLLTLGLAAFAGWMLMRSKPAEDVLKEADRRYNAGVEALKSKNGAQAAQSFHEAKIMATSALERVEKERKDTAQPTPEQMKQWTDTVGAAFYLKARAMRDEVYAKGMADGKEIEESLDTSTGKTYRHFGAIADPKSRQEAVASLRMAAGRLAKDADLQEDALRAELMAPFVDWSFAQLFAKALIEIRPSDTRARYVLARVEFEQPQIARNLAPMPLDKRSRTRVNDAVTHLNKVKETKDYPPGRTYYLEAQIRHWLARDYVKREDEAQATKQYEMLDKLLFDAKTGALAVAATDAGVKNLSVWDLEGFLGVHLLGIDVSTERSKYHEPESERIQAIVPALAAYCKRVESERIGQASLDKLGLAMVDALSKTHGTLAKEAPKVWHEGFEVARDLLTKAQSKEIAPPTLTAAYASLLLRESNDATKAGNTKRADELRKEALTRVQEALAQAQKRKLPVENLYELHAVAAEMLFATAGASKDVEAHLAPIFASKQAKVQGFAHLLRGALLEREGRLDKAREHLEAALKSGNTDLDLRANMALTSVYMGLGQAGRALVSLRSLERIYDRYEELSPQERAFAQQFLRGPEDLLVLVAAANLDAARQGLVAFLRDTPGKAVPPSLFQDNEKAAEEILQKLPPTSKHSLEVRRALIAYFARTGRFERAEKELAAAYTHHPGGTGLLSLDVELLLQKAQQKVDAKQPKTDMKAVQAGVDAKIQDFIKRFPNDRPARLQWVSWLLRTNRGAESLAYLRNPVNFPGAKDDTYNRMLAIVLANTGDRQESAKLLQQLPHDPVVDALLILIGESDQAKQKSIQEAMTRHVSNGLFRLWNAELASADKRHAEAARLYFNVLEFTAVRAAAEAGLQRSLVALAEQEPRETRKLLDEMLKERPDEPVLLLAYALTLLNLDELGSPDDEWPAIKSMSSALNGWEVAALRKGINSNTVALVRAELWLRSNQLEVARTEILRAANQSTGNVAALQIAFRLNLAMGTKAQRAEAAMNLQQLKSIDKGSAANVVFEAQLLHAEKQTAKAVDLLASLTDKQPPEADAYALLVAYSMVLKQPAKALEWSEAWVKRMPESTAAAVNLVANLAHENKLDDAKKKAEAFTDARLKEIAKRFDDAKRPDDKDLAKTRKALLDDARWELHLEFARAFVVSNALAEAETRYEQLQKEKPDQPRVLLALGDIHVKRKDYPKAVHVYEQVLKQEKWDFIAGNNLAWILAVEMKQPAKALELLRTIATGRHSGKHLPGDRLHSEVLDTLGTVYQRISDPSPELTQEMIGVFERASKRYPRDGRIYLYLGLAHAAAKDSEKAAQALQSAAALAKDAENISMSQDQRDMVLREVAAAAKRLPKS
jgi:tetratricopeptide (TPR) repeat protein